MEYLSWYIDRFFKTFSNSKIKYTEINCLYQSITQFCKTGNKIDAFSVYYCFSEIFRIFGTGYDNTKKLLEILSDYEYHAASLLRKHRDHYSHSVYVFVLGLALYSSCNIIKKSFSDYYGCDDSSDIRFLHLWGMTALFHDVGYPFEIAHDEIKTYISDIFPKQEDPPFVSYANLNRFISFTEEQREYLEKRLTHENHCTMNDLLSFWLNKKLGYDREKVEEVLKQEQVSPNFQDHAYFSSILLIKFLFDNNRTQSFTMEMMDVISAILLHNSLNRFHIDSFSHPIGVDEFPLSYLLMLTDNLQDWDREAFGQKTKSDPQAWDVKLEITNNEVTIEYIFDSFDVITPGNMAHKRKNKKVESIQSGVFAAEILEMITNRPKIRCVCFEQKKKKRSHIYASSYNYVNLCDFAKSIHANYVEQCYSLDIDYLNKAFGELTLEQKLSNIEQAKSYAYKLELVNCFFSDKELDYPIVFAFEEKKNHQDELEFLAREEHVRWVKEKLKLGWRYGIDYINQKDGSEDKAVREKIRQHKDMLPYDLLDEESKEKDRIMVRNMIPFLYRHANGMKIYRYRYGKKPVLQIVAVGHRKVVGNIKEIKEKISNILESYSRDYHVIVRSCFAPGSDLLVMECANELGLTTKANLPLLLNLKDNEDVSNYLIARRNIKAYLKYMYTDAEVNGFIFSEKDEIQILELLSQTSTCHINADKQYAWMEPIKHMINKCDKIIALWDGVETKLELSDVQSINYDGTYHCICMAREKGLKVGRDIHIIPVKSR